MYRFNIANAKNQFSKLLDAVRAGESILIVDRDQPVARLEPVTDVPAGELTGTLSRLERAGLLRRAAAVVPDELLAPPPGCAPPARDDALLQALLDDRREGR